MARTYRNRKVLPRHWECRDNGVLYYKGTDKWGDATYGWQLPHHLFVSKVWRRGEKKSYRKAHFRSYRAKVKNLMHHERWDDILPYQKTCGWLSW